MPDTTDTSRIRHIVMSQQFDPCFLERLFRKADEFRRRIIIAEGMLEDLRGRVMAVLFYEPSTRTRLSFESAMYRLGGRVIGTENAREFSSAAKGETLEDTVRVVAGYADVIVLRHHESGASQTAADAIDGMTELDHPVHIINAGDGSGQHPTQALLDMYTIQRELKRLGNISVAMCGDLLNGRTARSLAYLLSKYHGQKIIFVAPDELQMKPDILEHLTEHEVVFSLADDIREVAPHVDVIYQTRVQKERGSVMGEDADGRFRITREVLDAMRPGAIVMHPLPRVGEISPEVDEDPRAAYFRQAHNGLYVRMALLKMILGGLDFDY